MELHSEGSSSRERDSCGCLAMCTQLKRGQNCKGLRPTPVHTHHFTSVSLHHYTSYGFSLYWHFTFINFTYCFTNSFHLCLNICIASLCIYIYYIPVYIQFIHLQYCLFNILTCTILCLRLSFYFLFYTYLVVLLEWAGYPRFVLPITASLLILLHLIIKNLTW